MMIKTWEIGGNGVPYGVHPLDVLNVFREGYCADNVTASEIDWNDVTIVGYEMVARFADMPVGSVKSAPVPAAIPQPAPSMIYQTPVGYCWVAAGTYHEFRKMGNTDEDLIDCGYLVPVVAPSAVPTKNPNVVLDSKESLVYAPEKLPEFSFAPLREDLDPQSRYYDAGGIETIDVIKAKLTPEQLRGYLLGNLIKYSCRMNFKGSAVRDAEKCKYYSQWLAELEQ